MTTIEARKAAAAQRDIDDLLRRRQEAINMRNAKPGLARSPAFGRIIERYNRMLAARGVYFDDD